MTPSRRSTPSSTRRPPRSPAGHPVDAGARVPRGRRPSPADSRQARARRAPARAVPARSARAGARRPARSSSSTIASTWRWPRACAPCTSDRTMCRCALVRRWLGAEGIIGLSTHTPRADRRGALRADRLSRGRADLRHGARKDTGYDAVGLDARSRTPRSTTELPIVAIGGITLARAARRARRRRGVGGGHRRPAADRRPGRAGRRVPASPPRGRLTGARQPAGGGRPRLLRLFRNHQLRHLLVGRFRQDLLADQLVLRLVRAAGDDLVGVRLADARQRDELLARGRVEIDRLRPSRAWRPARGGMSR